MDLQNSIHFILQGKGGIGKSFISAVFAQWLQSKIDPVHAYDTDQVNTTFAHYKALNVQHIPVMTDSLNIDVKRFDSLIEQLVANEGGAAIIDNGANTFAPLLAYMVENEVIGFLQDTSKKVFIHTIVGGGDTFADTATGFKSIAEGMPQAPLVLWMNEHFGELKSPQDKHFTDMKVFQQHESRILGTVLLEARNHQTYGDDIKHMNKERLTFDEVMQSTSFNIMEKQRLKNVARDVFKQLDEIAF